MNNGPTIPNYKLSEKEDACFRNERYWVEALAAILKDIDSMPKPIAPIKINILFNKQSTPVYAPFKSPNFMDEGYGETTGLVLVEGQAFVINLRGNILRRSSLSLGIINLISNYCPIPELRDFGITQKDLSLEKIDNLDMELFYEGKATINDQYRQYESIRYLLQILEIDKQTKLQIIYTWARSIIFDDKLFESFTRDLKHCLFELPEVKLVILKAILDNNSKVSEDMINSVLRSSADYSEADVASLISLIIDPRNATLIDINELNVISLIELAIEINRGDLLLEICGYDFPYKNTFSYISINALFAEPFKLPYLKLLVSIITSNKFAHAHLINTLHTSIIYKWLVYFGVKDVYLSKIAQLYPIAKSPF